MGKAEVAPFRNIFDNPSAVAEAEALGQGYAPLMQKVLSMEIDEVPVATMDSGVLFDLPEDSKLYIHGHGHDGDSHIQYHIGDDMTVEMSMPEMAEWLFQGGLPRDRHYDIRLRMCHSGCSAPGGGLSMAAQFRNAMQGFGYDNVDVSGYVGDVLSAPLILEDGLRHFLVQDVHGSGAHLRRSDNRITYKADGSVINNRVVVAEQDRADRAERPAVAPKRAAVDRAESSDVVPKRAAIDAAGRSSFAAPGP
jgi:hypothetical protein